MKKKKRSEGDSLTEPVFFAHANGVLKGQPEANVSDLAVFRGGGDIVSCWRISRRGWRKLRRSKRIFVWLHVPDDAQPPPICIDVRTEKEIFPDE